MTLPKLILFNLILSVMFMSTAANACENRISLNAANQGFAPVVVAGLTADNWRDPLKCLFDALQRLMMDVQSDKFDKSIDLTWSRDPGRSSELKRTFVALASPIIEIFDRFGRSAIHRFRILDNFEVVRFLARASRDGERAVRANATLILGNVVDNTTLCIVLDELYGIQEHIKETEDSNGHVENRHVRGRANLIAVARVVAVWALQENYCNLRQLHSSMHSYVEKHSNSNNLRQTMQLLDDLQGRLNRNDKRRNTTLDEAGLAMCKESDPLFATSSVLTYTDWQLESDGNCTRSGSQ